MTILKSEALLFILQNPILADTGNSKHLVIDDVNHQITVSGVQIVGHLIFSQDIKYFSINFRSCTFGGNFVIHCGTFKNLSFTKCHPGIDLFNINGGTFENFSFESQQGFKSIIRIQGGDFGSLSFEGGSAFGGQLVIGDCTIRMLHIADSRFENGISLFLPKEIHFFVVKNAQISELNFHDGNFHAIRIESRSAIDKLNITGGQYGSVYLNSENITEFNFAKKAKNIELHLGKVKLAQLGKVNGFFYACQILKLEFEPSYIHKDTILRFLNVTVDSISFNGLINYGQLGFSNLQLTQEISICNSDLGKTSFINSNLSLVKMNFVDSRITDAFFSKSSFPKRIAVDDYQQRQAFAQLKKINEAKGDYLEANHFYAKEMNAFYRTISWKNHFWEKLNLFFNKFSNNHGQSWQLGLCAVLIVALFFFLLYLFGLGIGIGSTHNVDDRALFVKCLSYFPEFLNPVHRTDEIAKGIGRQASSSSRIIEGVSRVFIAFTIYQLIQAFRKHGKK